MIPSPKQAVEHQMQILTGIFVADINPSQAKATDLQKPNLLCPAILRSRS